MDKAQFLSKIQEIGTCEDDAQRRALLAEVNDGISEVFDNVDSLTETNNSLTANNETLREANMQLFLRVGEKKDPEDLTPPGGGSEPLKYENLFNEKGELK